MVGMPSPFHEFSTVDEAAKYMNITPQMPKVLPVGYNIESVSTIDKDVLQMCIRDRVSREGLLFTFFIMMRSLSTYFDCQLLARYGAFIN